ncbi:hypothetical protein YC2023_002393 [Brassica napus]
MVNPVAAVMFCFTNSGYCRWYDTKSREWREVKGSDMEVLHKSEDGLAGRCLVQIVNHGGKLLVIWVPRTKEYRAERKRRIWCARIAFEKRREGEIWGKLEWVNEVLTFKKDRICLLDALFGRVWTAKYLEFLNSSLILDCSDKQLPLGALEHYTCDELAYCIKRYGDCRWIIYMHHYTSKTIIG